MTSFSQYNDIFAGQDASEPKWPKWQAQWMRLYSRVLLHLAQHRYSRLTQAQLLSRKTSDSIFIFGSGLSIESLSPEEWEAFSRHNTMGFNWFAFNQRVRIDYHLVRETVAFNNISHMWRVVRYYGELIAENICYSNCVLIYQDELRGFASARLLASGALREGMAVFPYHTKSRGKSEPPSKSFSEGLVHGASTLIDSINFASIMGYRHIVLVGVDLYDSRYFFAQDGDKSTECQRGNSADDKHHSTRNEIIPFLESWGRHLANQGQRLSVYNPRSLLAEVLPTYPSFQKTCATSNHEK
ncbi:MAG: hypothetical protein HQL44_05250 [Alphaproteobacteria bacterium]|nr:hypothetical protein [Alphaproteobacteria bacterium]